MLLNFHYQECFWKYKSRKSRKIFKNWSWNKSQLTDKKIKTDTNDGFCDQWLMLNLKKILKKQTFKKMNEYPLGYNPVKISICFLLYDFILRKKIADRDTLPWFQKDNDLNSFFYLSTLTIRGLFSIRKFFRIYLEVVKIQK